MRYLLRTVLFLVCLFPLGQIFASIESQVDNLFTKAEQIYWLSLQEGGNPDALRLGLKYLNDANQTLNASPNQKLQDRLDALHLDISKQLEISQDTFWGVFPLARFFSTSLFADSLSLGTFELIDQASVRASVQASAALREVLAQTVENYGQANAIFLSSSSENNLENEVLFQFNKDSNFFVHHRSELISLTGKKEFLSLYQKDTDWNDKIQRFLKKNAPSLRSAFSNQFVLFVTIDDLGSTESKDKFYAVSGHFWDIGTDPENPEIAQLATFSSYGHSRDRNHLFWVLCVANLALISTALYTTRKTIKKQNNLNWIVWGIIAFVVGKITVSLSGFTLGTFSPSSETLWYVSAWFPLLGCLLFTLLPVWVLIIFKNKFPTSLSIPAPSTLMPSLTIGVFSSLGADLMLWNSSNTDLSAEQAGLLILLLASLYIAITGACKLIEFWEKSTPMILSAMVCGLLLLSVGYFGCDLTFLGASVLAFIPIWKFSPNKECSELSMEMISEKPDIIEPLSSKIAWLIQDCSDPNVIEIPEFELITEQFHKDSSHTFIQGIQGAGKTSLLAQMKSRWQETHEGIVRTISCEQPIARTSEDSFTILSDLLGINLRQDSKDTGSGIGDLILDSFPVFAFVKSAVENIGGQSGQPGNEREIEAQVKRWLSELYEKENQPILILIDGAEWLDEGSASVVNSLLQWNPPSDFLTLVLSANDQLPKLIQESLLEKHSITDAFHSTNRLKLFEKLRLGKDIVDFLQNHFTGKPAGLWRHLTESIKHLAKDGKIGWSELSDSFVFDPEVDRSQLMIPKFHERIGEMMRENPQHTELLRCAAILGSEFKATILAEIMSIPRMQLLQKLELAERETGLIFDRFHNDDFFHIPPLNRRSILEHTGVTYSNSDQNDLPQIIREIHAQNGLALLNQMCGNSNDSNNIEEIADQFFYAGDSHAALAWEWNLKAAKFASSVYLFEKAEWRLEIAQKFAHTKEQSTTVEVEKLQLLGKWADVKRDVGLSEKCLNECLEWAKSHEELNPEVQLIILRMRHQLADEKNKFRADAHEKDESNNKEEALKLCKENIREADILIKYSKENLKEELSTADIITAEAIQFQALANDMTGNTELALSLYSEAENLIANTDRPETQLLRARILDSHAWALLPLGREKDAEALFEESLQCKELHQDKTGMAISTTGLAICASKMGDTQKSLVRLEQARSLNNETGSYEFEVRNLLSIIQAQQVLGNKNAVWDTIKQSKEILESGQITDLDDLNSLKEELREIEKKPLPES
jgi:tetratricopeptide (TPR) repeat protein